MKEPQDRIQKKNLLLSYYTKGDASSINTTAAANESTGKSARGDTTTSVSSSSLGTAATETTTNITNTNKFTRVKKRKKTRKRRKLTDFSVNNDL